MNDTIRLMLVEDNEDYRNGIVFVMDNMPGIEVISQYGTAEFALRNLQEAAEESLPDIILLDINLPGMSGLDAIPLIKQQASQVKIIVLTQSDEEADVLYAIRMGAAGYLLKSASNKVLTDGIKLVHSGGATLDQNLARFILKTIRQEKPPATPEINLSERELSVLTLIAEGQLQKQISSSLDIRAGTVNEYIRRIYNKLNVQNAPAAVAKAYRSGILPADE